MLDKLLGALFFERLFAMFLMSTCGELTSVPKTRHLAGFFVFTGGVLIPDEPSEEGVRLSRTGNSNLTT